jgi:L-asparaginase II
MRSSAKPFQAITVLATGADDRFGWTDEEVAVVCASHAAEDKQIAVVRSILSKAGMTENDLQCGPHPPADNSTRDALIRAEEPPRRIHNNCSGKHAGMLSACRAAGWDPSNYLHADHPLQRANAATVQTVGRIERTLETGVDGCGVPTFYATVEEIARMYAGLASEMKDNDRLHPLASRVSWAMRTHPERVSATGHFTAELTRLSAGRIIVKGGAEGVLGIGVPELGLGMAIKVADGSSRPLPAIACRLLAEYLPALDWATIRRKIHPPITNTLSAEVGTIEAAF